MTGAGMKYGALSAKVHALYGKRLRTEGICPAGGDEERGGDSGRFAAASGWSKALSQCVPGGWKYVGRIEVEQALREELRLEYLSLAHYVPREDRPLMEFRVRIAERTAILNALRRLKVGKYAKGMPPAPRIVLQGKVDYKALRECTSYDQLLSAAKGSIYYPVLLNLRPEPGGPLPDYTTAESLLRTAYFAHMFRIARERYSGATQKVLLQAMGGQVDLLNIIHILRLKTYFPDTSQEEYLKHAI